MFNKIAILLLFGSSLFSSAAEQKFVGWEGLRVFPVEGAHTATAVGDIKGTGRESLMVANRRMSKIEIYDWLPVNMRKKVEAISAPNELPTAVDFQKSEIALDRPPHDLNLVNLDDDKELELIVVTILPLKLHLYELKKDKWELQESWILPNVELQNLSMLYHQDSVFLSTTKGILVQKLVKGGQSEWLTPIENNINRFDWWSFDVNADGKKDLVDLVGDSANGAQFRWFENNGVSLLPAVPLGNIRAVSGILDTSVAKGRYYLKSAIKANSLDEYELQEGDKQEFGKNRLIPRLNLRDDAMTSIEVDGKKMLVEIDSQKPSMRVSVLTENGFVQLGNFPILRNTKVITAPIGQNFLLMQVGESSELYISRWEKGRFTYPEVYNDGAPALKEQKLLGLGRHAGVVWWISSVEDVLTLNTWKEKSEKPEQIIYKGVEKGLDQAFWLSEKWVMTRKKFAKNGSFYNWKEGKSELVDAAHLKDAAENQFRFFKIAGQVKMGRIVDGILQWYGDKLQPVEQIMFENSDKISAISQNGRGGFYVIDQAGDKIHEFTADASGVMKAGKLSEILMANNLRYDEVLGLVLETPTVLNAVREGKPWVLKLKNTITEKVGLPQGVKNAFINDYYLIDVTGDKKFELLFTDFSRNQLTLADISNGTPTALASWKVFDDGSYPYGGEEGGGKSNGGNPSIITSLDFDGDGVKELALWCHDRLIIYLGKESQ